MKTRGWVIVTATLLGIASSRLLAGDVAKKADANQPKASDETKRARAAATDCFDAAMPTTPPPGKTTDNFLRLREGMTGAQVEAMLGVPDEETDEGEGDPYTLWNGKGIVIYLWFGDDGRLKLSFRTPWIEFDFDSGIALALVG